MSGSIVLFYLLDVTKENKYKNSKGCKEKDIRKTMTENHYSGEFHSMHPGHFKSKC
jgi:hypothetical protein